MKPFSRIKRKTLEITPYKGESHFPSELRMDTLSEEWVVVATGRAKRPEAFKKEKRHQREINSKNCVFCHLENEKPIFALKDGKPVFSHHIPRTWDVLVLPNKFPVFL